MSHDILVSIILPFYNTAQVFMGDAIESVLKQTYKNWEILLVDDGSTNDSTILALSYAEKHSEKIVYLEHPEHANRGASSSRQLAVSHARGLYIALLDSDDVWLPKKLEIQVDMLNSQPEAIMLYGNTKYWFSWTKNPKDSKRDFIPALGVQPESLVQPPKLLPLFLSGKAAVPCPTSTLFRRDAIDKFGGLGDSFPGSYEDQALYTKICLGSPVYVSGRCLEWYRQHTNSICHKSQMKGLSQQDRLIFLKWMTAYLVEQGVKDVDIWLALKRQLWLYQIPSRNKVTGENQVFYRWVKKWLLRFEERTLPVPVQNWLWKPEKGSKQVLLE